MKNSTIIATLFGIVLVLLATSIPVQTQAQSVTEVQSNPPPNKVLNIVRQSGNCPQNVGLWIISFGYRDEAAMSEQIVIADTLAFAGRAKLATSRFRFVEYQAPLQQAYADCVGQAISPTQPNSLDARYKFRFQNRNVYFSIDLTNTPEGFGAGIVEHKIVGLRPYALWQFID
ncbi:hypothetical protein [Argonema antarcticum]|uniref:hypothetical protein n=1 Tax=Argonema antarcticum TaxID=2942763 RepID=UPI002012ED60|nr:hypothetical protein [Argonema antarcticum]MCL1474487.1 hypothetical protein [Argonema antarcticum A004/B2]